MQVGKTKDQDLYNKPSAAVHPGALAAGTLPQYNTIQRVVLLTQCYHRNLIIFVQQCTAYVNNHLFLITLLHVFDV